VRVQSAAARTKTQAAEAPTQTPAAQAPTQTPAAQAPTHADDAEATRARTQADAVETTPPQAGLRLTALGPDTRTRVEEILRATGVFREDEVGVALEVLDSFFAHPEQDYATLGAFTPGGRLLGYVCWGPTPCTHGTYDVYWIAVEPGAQTHGVGTLLLAEVERRLARENARLVIVETSSTPVYDATRAFYLRRGYDEVARVPDYYQPGDDRVIYAKRLGPQPLG
jgi:ribosomal protein S18 acetylase RimI-like enzyme